MSTEITAAIIEDIFGRHSDSVRFANFCNAVVMAEGYASAATTIPILSEKTGADGGMDGEWTIPTGLNSDFNSAFALPGWNVFQYKARSIAGDGRQKAFANLRSNLKGARAKLIDRLAKGKECCQYSLFTNLQLGLETPSKGSDERVFQEQRAQLQGVITEGGEQMGLVKIFDAAQLAAIVNTHPALRLTYFSGSVARSWQDFWEAEKRIKNYKVTVPFVGRRPELNQIDLWLKDTTTKIIMLCGPSGMGKTRLALEATSPFSLFTMVAEEVDELLRMDFQAFGTSKTKCFMIVEDPTREQAEALAKKAIVSDGVKLILTVPTDAKAPVPKLTDHEAIQTLPALGPLSDSDAENLLKTAGASFDRQALDWILLQAGGNPEILLSAAELQDDLREKSGDLKKRLYERFRRKIENELSVDALRALKTLSPVLYVKVRGEDSELPVFCNSLGLGIQEARISEMLADLERMGYIRRRGTYVSVVPPLFAARLVEDLASTQEHSMRTLFNALSKDSRGRFLERMVTVDLPENSIFWDFMFGENGPLESAKQEIEQIDRLARAVPARTARYLENKLNDQKNEAWKSVHLIGTLRELAYDGDSCVAGMRCLELLAIEEIEQTGQIKNTIIFCECFVDWFHQFPMSFQARMAWVQRLLGSEHKSQRLLGTHVVAFVTAPPQSLSGHTVTARRLGQPPPTRLWRDVFNYVAELVEIRFTLTQVQDEDIAQIARNGLEHMASQLFGHVFPDQLVVIMEKLVDWNFTGKLLLEVRQIRSALYWLEERYSENSRKTGEEEYRDKWADGVTRLGTLRKRYDDGDFLLRFQIATGHDFDMEQEDGEYGTVYRYQTKLRLLALEANSNPDLMTEDVWNAVKDSNTQKAGEFLQLLGEHDLAKQFLKRFESEAGDNSSDWRFGLYCLGLYRANGPFVEQYFDQLAKKPHFKKSSFLFPIGFIGPTQKNRERLLQLIGSESVTSLEVATIFTYGRWLENVPVSEVVAIMDYIAQGDGWPERTVKGLSHYLNLNKPLPNELIPLCERTLQEISTIRNEGYHCNKIAIEIAKVDLERGFVLLAKRIAVLNTEDWRVWRGRWNPLERYGGNEFWNYLRSKDAERAYRCYCTLKNREALNAIIVDDDKSLVDLQNHSQILLKIAGESEENAKRISSAVTIKQPGFFPFAFKLLAGRPIDGEIASYLSSTILERSGFGSPLDRLQTALNRIQSELKISDIPEHGRAWLDSLSHQVQVAIRSSPWNNGERENLGWH